MSALQLHGTEVFLRSSIFTAYQIYQSSSAEVADILIETPFLQTVSYKCTLHVIRAAGLTILSVVEGPCQGFTRGVVPATHSALVISGLRVKNVVTARLLKRRYKICDLYTVLKTVRMFFTDTFVKSASLGDHELGKCRCFWLWPTNTSLKTQASSFPLIMT